VSFEGTFNQKGNLSGEGTMTTCDGKRHSGAFDEGEVIYQKPTE
jgi:hypothetical protein